MSIFSATERDQVNIANVTYNVGSIGIFQLQSYSDNITGEQSDRYFMREFAVSNDNLLFTSYQILSDENLQKITTSVPANNLFFKIKYTRIGTNNTGTLILNSISFTSSDTGLSVNTILAQYPKTLRTVFKDIVVYSPVVLEISNNLLEKVKGNGILSSFIVRAETENPADLDDTDDFWSSICTFLAYVVSFSQYLLSIYSNPILLAQYLKSHNLILSGEETITELQFLAQHFYEEIFRRGTVAIVKDQNSNTLDGNPFPTQGELLRLIAYHYLTDEFVWNLPSQKDYGWCVGQSSPLYKGLSRENEILFKAYENTKSPVDKTKYPLKNSTNVHILSDTFIDGNSVNVFTISTIASGQYSGIYGGYDILTPFALLNSSKRIKVNPNLNYEIIAWVKHGKFILNENFIFGCYCFDINMNLINCISAKDGSTINTFANNLETIPDNKYQFIRGIIHPQSSTPNSTQTINIGIGNNLIFGSSAVQYIIPFLYLDNQDGGGITSGTAYIYDFKVKMSYLPYSLGFVQLKNLFYLFMQNNNASKTQQQLYDIIREFLLPHDTNLLINLLDHPYTEIGKTTTTTSSTTTSTTLAPTTTTSTTSTTTHTTSSTTTTTTCPPDSLSVVISEGGTIVTISGTPSPIDIIYTDSFGNVHDLGMQSLPFVFDPSTLIPPADGNGTYYMITAGGCTYIRYLFVGTTTTTTASPTSTTTSTSTSTSSTSTTSTYSTTSSSTSSTSTSTTLASTTTTTLASTTSTTTCPPNDITYVINEDGTITFNSGTLPFGHYHVTDPLGNPYDVVGFPIILPYIPGTWLFVADGGCSYTKLVIAPTTTTTSSSTSTTSTSTSTTTTAPPTTTLTSTTTTTTGLS